MNITEVIDIFLDEVIKYLIRPVEIYCRDSSREYEICTRNHQIARIYIITITDEIIIQIRYDDQIDNKLNKPIAEFEISDPNFTPEKVAEIINKNLVLVASKYKLPTYEGLIIKYMDRSLIKE